MVYGYIRVSTDVQSVENQKYEIDNFATSKGIGVNEYIGETISGMKSYSKRLLGKLLRKLKKGDILICSELSRLGRSLYMIMDILNYCLTKEVIIMTIKDRFVLGDDIESKVLAFAFGLSAEIERKLISQRTKEALQRIKSEGKKLGRPLGRRSSKRKLEDSDIEIYKYVTSGRSYSWIASKYKCSKSLVYQYIKKNRYRSPWRELYL